MSEGRQIKLKAQKNKLAVHLYWSCGGTASLL